MVTAHGRLCLRLVLTIFVCLALARCTTLESLTTQRLGARVIRVIDGDTIKVDLGGRIHTVRLLGVDTPETKHPTKQVQYFGREASAFTKKWLHGKTVELARDPMGDTRDRYGRLLRYVFVGGDNFNAKLIREGYAYAYRRFPFSQRSKFIRLEAEAKQKGRGLWANR